MCDDHSGTTVEILGRKTGIDSCIAPLVRTLNKAGFLTAASCCGHGHRPGNIALVDGRELIIAPDFATARRIDALFPTTSYGEVSHKNSEGIDAI